MIWLLGLLREGPRKRGYAQFERKHMPKFLVRWILRPVCFLSYVWRRYFLKHTEAKVARTMRFLQISQCRLRWAYKAVYSWIPRKGTPVAARERWNANNCSSVPSSLWVKPGVRCTERLASWSSATWGSALGPNEMHTSNWWFPLLHLSFPHTSFIQAKRLEADKRDIERQLQELQVRVETITRRESDKWTAMELRQKAELKVLREISRDCKSKLMDALAPPKWE